MVTGRWKLWTTIHSKLKLSLGTLFDCTVPVELLSPVTAFCQRDIEEHFSDVVAALLFVLCSMTIPVVGTSMMETPFTATLQPLITKPQIQTLPKP